MAKTPSVYHDYLDGQDNEFLNTLKKPDFLRKGKTFEQQIEWQIN